MTWDALAVAYRAKVLPKLASIAAAGSVVDAHAWLAFDWPTAPLALDFSADRGTAVLVMRDDLHDRPPADVELRCVPLDFDPVRVSQRVMGVVDATGDDLGYPDFCRRHLEHVARARYALILVVSELRMPALEGAHGFTAGMVSGVGIAIELAGLAVAGGFEFTAINTLQVRGRDSTIERRLRDDLSRAFGQAVRRGIEARFAGSTLPPTLGY